MGIIGLHKNSVLHSFHVFLAARIIRNQQKQLMLSYSAAKLQMH